MIDNTALIQNSTSVAVECAPWEDLHKEYHRAIWKRLRRRGDEYIMHRIQDITAIDRLDALLEALLEDRSLYSICEML